MAQIIDAVRLPVQVEQGSKMGPGFHTSIVPLTSGREQANADWPDPRLYADISYGIDTIENYQGVRDFFYARRGRFRGFLFRDWSDYQMTLEQIGTGNGVQADFPIIKTYEAAGPAPYVRRITRPDLSTLFLYLNGVAQGSGFTITNQASAIGVLTGVVSDNFANGETVTIGDQTYTAKTGPLTAGNGNFLIGASWTASLTNLARAINQSGAGADVTSPATGALTMTSNFSDADTVTVGATSYTAQTSFTASAGHFLIGASGAASLINLQNVINQDGAPGGSSSTHAVADLNGFEDNFSDGDQVVVTMPGNNVYSIFGTVVGSFPPTTYTYTAKSVFTAGKGNFLIGVNWAASFTNLARAINQTGSGADTLYDHANTPANGLITASETSPLVATAITGGTAGDQIQLSTSQAYVAWQTTNMAGGANAVFGIGFSVVTPAVSATDTLVGGQRPGNFADGDTVTINSTTYAAKNPFTAGAGHFAIGNTIGASFTNLARAINQTGVGAGTLYDHASTSANTDVTATEASPMVITAITAGTGGNGITLSTVSNDIFWDRAATSGGNNSGSYDDTNTAANASVTAVASGTVLTVTARTAGTTGNSIGTTTTTSGGAWGAATLAGGTDALYDHANTTANEFVTASESSPLVATAVAGGPAYNSVATTTTAAHAAWASTTLTGGEAGGGNHVIHFTGSPPAVGVAVQVTTEFDNPVRFDSDKLQHVVQTFDAAAIESIPVIGIRE